MAGNLQQRLGSLGSKALLLTERYERMSESLRQAQAEIADLKHALAERETELGRLRQELEHTRVVSVISHDKTDVELTRTFLAELVRDIDKCINEINE